jgi:hypothetical protein
MDALGACGRGSMCCEVCRMMLGNMPGTEKWELTDSCQYLSRNARCDRNDQEILVDVVIVLGDGLC